MQTLGLDLGSNSIGWALVDTEKQENQITSCGVYRYQLGIKKDQGKEISLAAERTGFRALRRQYFRRKLRKYHTLKLLIEAGMCPLSYEELNEWCRYHKGKAGRYPSSPEFRAWLKTTSLSKSGEGVEYNPYVLRFRAVREKLSAYELGRIFYHMAQRRGFKSNRKAETKESDGVVNTSINELSSQMGERTLGEYFYELWKKGERIRKRYTSREAHYVQEFNAICDFQQIDTELRDKLKRVLFFQRPLRSQKYTVGNCTLEKNKPRAPISHYLFEEYRAWAFINNVKTRMICEEARTEFEPLSAEQKEKLADFLLSKRESFPVTDILKCLYGKQANSYECNYRHNDTVPGSPVISGLKAVFGNNWRDCDINGYKIEDIWHNLFFFDDNQKLQTFARDTLGLDENAAKRFCAISIKQGYASYSLKAIKKILPFLKKGYQLAMAVFMAKLPEIVGSEYWQEHEAELESKVVEICASQKDTDRIIRVANASLRRLWRQPYALLKDHVETEDIPIIRECFDSDYDQKSWKHLSIEEKERCVNEVIDLIHQNRMLDTRRGELLEQETSADRLSKYIAHITGREAETIRHMLYHPAENEWYDSCVEKDGKKYLGSPELPALKNPLVMRTLHSLKKLLNYLISTDAINEFTPINIELANELNDKNMRAAIAMFQKERENENNTYRTEIQNCLLEQGIQREVTDEDVRKCRLWHEQDKKCLYTNKEINFCRLFDLNPEFDIEHTVPRSFVYDNSLENVTVCDNQFNREIKKNKMPFQLAEYESILHRAELCYKRKADEYWEKYLAAAKRSKKAATPEAKAAAIQKKHLNLLWANYYKEKYRRFACTEFDPSFTNRQLVDTRIITRYAKFYLKTVFHSVMPIKGSLTKEFRVLWGLQKEYCKKDRSSHVHHAIDAITLACMTRQMRENLTKELQHLRPQGHFVFTKPWDTFTEDSIQAVNSIVVAHQRADNEFSASRHVRITHGKKIRSGGDTVRGCLHQDTLYGKINMRTADGKEEVVSVIKRSFDSPSFKIESIVDPVIRHAAEEAGIKKMVSDGVLYVPRKDGSLQPVYAVRTVAKTAKNALPLRELRDVSAKLYKRFQYVVNDTNYAMAIYAGKDAKGKCVRDYVVVNLLDAARRRKEGKAICEQFIEKKGVRLELIYFLRNGMNVILWESDPDEVVGKSVRDLMNRMYFIAKMTGGMVYLQANHQAAAVSDKEVKWSVFSASDDVYPRRGLRHTQFNALIEGVDFYLRPDGSIQYIDRL